MKIFIRATSCISPQQTFDHKLFSKTAIEYNANTLKVIEPDYKNILDVKLMRRMSRIVRIGLATALQCVSEAGLENVDAITTGTAYGCMEDSEKFLRTIVEQNEEMLSPTSFIQSTHNTVAAQIALTLKCNNYNNTFVHRGFSFEHALIDTILLLKENSTNYILTGSADEMTDFAFSILKRFGLYKQSPISNFDLYKSNTRGSICGEGTAFFLLTNEASENNYAQLDGIETFHQYKNIVVIQERINAFLSNHNTSINDIDLVITGKNGDVNNDNFFDELASNAFPNNVIINYKHLCGEYPTASSFAVWLTANIIKRNQLPVCFQQDVPVQTHYRRILIYNIFQNKYHSLILLSSCNNSC